MQLLGEVLRGRRLELSLTLQAIADRMGVVPMYVSDIERNKRVPLKSESIEKLSAAYELDPLDVLFLAISSRDSVELDTKSASDEKKALAVALARQWHDLPAETVLRMRDMLNDESSRE